MDRCVTSGDYWSAQRETVTTTYTYRIYDKADVLLATFETDQPLSHLAIGHELTLANEVMVEYSSLVIRRIRVAITHTKSRPSGYEIHVSCEASRRP
jgi:hypothetical protein